jgi:anti-sigma28 factor (negative regulator of flagellin synthesis)
MPDIASIGFGSVGPLSRPGHGSAGTEATRPASLPGRDDTSNRVDRVEVSDQARLMARMKSMPDVRQNLIDQIKRQIQAGTYDTPERLDTALDRMIDELA